MAKYFKIVEIDEEEFNRITDEELDCCQITIPTGEGVFIGVAEEQEDEIRIPLDCFD